MLIVCRTLLRCLTFLLLASSSYARAETWADRHGRSLTGTPTQAYGPLVVISENDHARLLQVKNLDVHTLDRLADALAPRPSPARWADAKSAVSVLHSRLQVLEGEKLVEFQVGNRPEPEVYLVYFSAHWCGPCRRFTPGLVKKYQELKANPHLADKFELIFVSSDGDPRSQLKYVREAAMPWPVLRFNQLGRARAIERWAGNGIPCLVAVTREGHILFHSYRGSDYVGPEEPLKATEQLLQQLDPRNHVARREAHPLVVRLHERQSAATTRTQARPFLVGTGLDPALFKRVRIEKLVATLDVGADGRVQQVTTEPELPSVLADLFRRQAEEWLFLPTVEQGRAISTRVTLPLEF